MLREFVDRIVSLSSDIITPVEIGTGTYCRHDLHRVKAPWHSPPEIVKFKTLQGIIDFAQGDESLPGNGSLFFHVAAHNVVRLCGYLQGDNDNKRFVFAESCMGIEPFKFGVLHGLETFVIAIQSQFVSTGASEDILSMLGKVASERVQEHSDDGFSQSIQLRVGIKMKENVRVANPVALRPYRTFREVEQPESKFIIRLNDKDGLRVGLWEADGGAWQLDAIGAVRSWLIEKSNLKVIA